MVQQEENHKNIMVTQDQKYGVAFAFAATQGLKGS